MADAADERRAEGAWWKWLLGAAIIVLAAVIAGTFFLNEQEVDETAVGSAPEQPSSAEQQPTEKRMPSGRAGSIVSFVTITTSADQDVLVGREVQLSGLDVVSVAEDGAFYVSVEGRDERVLVVRDEETQVEVADAAEEGQQQPELDEGQTISVLEGTIESLSDAQLRKRDLAGTVGAGERVYILAERVAIDGAG